MAEQKALQKLNKGYGFTNGEVIPCEKYEYYFNINIQQTDAK